MEFTQFPTDLYILCSHFIYVMDKKCYITVFVGMVHFWFWLCGLYNNPIYGRNKSFDLKKTLILKEIKKM